MSGVLKIFPRPYRPPHKIVRAPRASKISADLQFYSPSYNFTETNRNLYVL